MVMSYPKDGMTPVSLFAVLLVLLQPPAHIIWSQESHPAQDVKEGSRSKEDYKIHPSYRHFMYERLCSNGFGPSVSRAF